MEKQTCNPGKKSKGIKNSQRKSKVFLQASLQGTRAQLERELPKLQLRVPAAYTAPRTCDGVSRESTEENAYCLDLDQRLRKVHENVNRRVRLATTTRR